MTTTQKAVGLGLLTEGLAASLVVLDLYLDVGSVHDLISLEQAPRAFHFLAQWTHLPAVTVLGGLDAVFEAALGLSGGNPAFFAGFGTPRPAWAAICLVQTILWVGFWMVVLTFGKQLYRRFSRVCRHAYPRSGERRDGVRL